MPFPKELPFNPSVSKVPVLGPSSGNPKAFQDPNSVASIGKQIQAATDQAKADTLYDTPPLKSEGFRNETYKPQTAFAEAGFVKPWILGTPACKREGYAPFPGPGSGPNKFATAALIIIGASLLLLSFSKK